MNDKPTPLQETIRAEAYLLSEKAGHPHGMEEFFWFQAEIEVLERHAAANSGNAPAKNARRKTAAKREVNRARAQIKKRKTGGRKIMAGK